MAKALIVNGVPPSYGGLINKIAPFGLSLNTLKEEQEIFKKRVIYSFNQEALSIFDEYDFVKNISFDLSAPSFNDGDPCYVGVAKFGFMADEIFMGRFYRSLVIEYEQNAMHERFPNPDKLREEYLNDSYRDSFLSTDGGIDVENHPFTAKHYELMCMYPKYEKLVKDLDSLLKFIRSFIRLFVSEFGDRNQVIVEKDTISIEDL